jgi:hypothetical protein
MLDARGPWLALEETTCHLMLERDAPEPGTAAAAPPGDQPRY